MTVVSMSMQRSRIIGSRIEFESSGGLGCAVRDGCFLLAIPTDLDVIPGTELCRQFYLPSVGIGDNTQVYRGFRVRPDIYFDREHFQTEHILLDGPGRQRHFPSELIMMIDRMHGLGLLVLRTVLAELNIPEAIWSKVTAGTVDGSGTHWFAASHYRTERDQLGCAPHKDTGFVTILYIEQEGLEAAVDGVWVPIDPTPGYFVVNFGGAFELLTEPLCRPVRAILHRVRKCVPTPDRDDRFSFAAFVNPPASGDLYQVHEDGSAMAVQSVEEFLREFNRTTWHDRHSEFGITGHLDRTADTPSGRSAQ